MRFYSEGKKKGRRNAGDRERENETVREKREEGFLRSKEGRTRECGSEG